MVNSPWVVIAILFGFFLAIMLLSVSAFAHSFEGIA